MLKPFVSSFVRSTPLRWYLHNKIGRLELIQRAIDDLSADSYLEIGVDEGACFCPLRVPKKIGVDPIPPHPDVARALHEPGTTYFSLTSDAFFERVAPRVLADGVDVVFVDGLHTYGQTYRDVTNALRHLNPGGVILVHDCLPASEAEARIADTYEEAGRLNGPDWSGLWTGDGWKAIVALRAGHADVEACVLNCDHGVGLVYKSANRSGLNCTPEAITALDYAALVAEPQKWIGLCAPARLTRVLRKQAALRNRA